MAKRSWLYLSTAMLAAGLAATEACVLDRSGTCEEPGGCVRVGEGGGVRPDGGGSGGESARGCVEDAECDDGNPCTDDACSAAGTCTAAAAADGVVGGTTCLPAACAGGQLTEEPAAAGTPCDGGFCDGVGACQPPLALGGGCQMDAQCASDNCVEGVCCEFACDGECEMCNPASFDQCEKHDPNDYDPDCGANTVCGGDGKCKAAG